VEGEGAETFAMTTAPVLKLSKITVPLVFEFVMMVIPMVSPGEMDIPVIVAVLGDHLNQASHEMVSLSKMAKSIPACKLALWNVYPSIPINADAVNLPEVKPVGREGVGTVTTPETNWNFLPVGGDFMTAPAQLVLNSTGKVLVDAGTGEMLPRVARAATRSARVLPNLARGTAKAEVARRMLMMRDVNIFKVLRKGMGNRIAFGKISGDGSG